jgi:hypothetical protein
MDNIQPGQQDIEWLSMDFDHIVNENEINIYAFCEGRQMNVVCMCYMKWIFCNLWCFDVVGCWNVSFGFYETGLGNFGEF